MSRRRPLTALTTRCPICGSRPGEVCTRLRDAGTDLPAGGPLTQPHAQRAERAAAKAQLHVIDGAA